MKLSVLMPVYNEAGTIEEVIRRVRAVRLPKEIIVVDDGSSDGTREILRRIEAEAWEDPDPLNEIKICFQPANTGKGGAIQSGIAFVTGDIVVIQDGDLEYDPADYMTLLDPILNDQADVVYGSRFLGSGPHLVLFFWHYLGNQFLTFLSNMLTNLTLSDMEVGYKVFRSEVLKGIRIKSQRFGFEPEVTIKVAKNGWRIYEVPISYHGRTYAEGKKITWKDGFAALYALIRFRLKS